jgi:hypothetical protein
VAAERDVPPPPEFDIRLVDDEAGVDFDEYPGSDGEITGTDGSVRTPAVAPVGRDADADGR